MGRRTFIASGDGSPRRRAPQCPRRSSRAESRGRLARPPTEGAREVRDVGVPEAVGDLGQAERRSSSSSSARWRRTSSSSSVNDVPSVGEPSLERPRRQAHQRRATSPRRERKRRPRRRADLPRTRPMNPPALGERRELAVALRARELHRGRIGVTRGSSRIDASKTRRWDGWPKRIVPGRAPPLARARRGAA